METLSIAERETGDPSLLISSLHLLVPPLQLLSAAMWKILQQQAVLHYGKLEQYVSLVMEAFPELLSESQRTELILGLQEFGSETNPALEVLLWEFLSALDQLLPVPDLKQTVSWLGAAPSVLEDCVQSVSYPDQLKTLLRHHRSLGQLGMNGTLSSIEEYNLSSMSRPPSHSMVYSTKLKNTNSQSESLTECMNFFSPASSGEDVRAESVIDRTDYKGVEPRLDLSRCGDIEETGYWMGTEKKDILTNRKDEEEEDEEEEEEEERQGVKMEREDVRHEEGHEGEEKVRDEQRDRNVNDQFDQTDKLMKNGVDSGHGQLEEEEHSTLVTSCLQKQPRVPIFRLEIASSSGPMSSPPRTIACKRSQIRGVKKRAKEGRLTEQAAQTDKFVKNGEKLELGQREKEMSSVISACLLKQPKVLIRRLEIVRTSVGAPSPPPCPIVKPLNANESLRQKSPDVTQKKKTVVQLEGPLGLLPSSSVNEICSEGSLVSPVASPSIRNTGKTIEVLSQIFACSQCPFIATEEVNLLHHIGKVHPEELSRAERSQQASSSTYLNLSPHKILRSPTQSHTGTPGAHICSQCGKSFRHFCRLRVHLQTHTGERPYHCPQCGRNFTKLCILKKHQRIHAGERPYVCLQCGKSFIWSCQLKLHLRVHTGERPYQCPQCGKSFTQLCILKKHQRRLHGGERPYVCSQCGKSFIWLCQLKLHLRVHTGERPYQCSQCGKSFTQWGTLRNHTRTHTGERPFQCSQCGKSFSQLSNLKAHQKVHTGKRPCICSLCPFVATEEVNLLKHIEKVHPEELSKMEGSQQPPSGTRQHPTHTGTPRAHTCSQCGKSFKYLCRLRVHLRTHTGERLYACSQCPKSFTQAVNLKQHERTHTGERPYHCSQCGRSFTQQTALRNHMTTHTGERPYQCSQCGKSFTQLSVLKKHQRIHVGDRPYICSQCGKSFIWSCQLKLHLRVHTGERPYQCSQCGKSFTQLSILKKHQRRLHVRERPYICSQCGKSFIWSCQLKLHLRVHTGERPHQCSQCGKSFTQLCILKKHQRRLHGGERPYICSQCGKSFIWLCQLKLHLRVHTGERPYQCSQCGKSFSQWSTLRNHTRTHTGERPFQCSQCGKSFTQLSNLKAHQKIHTGKPPYICFLCPFVATEEGNLLKHIEKVHPEEVSRAEGSQLPPSSSYLKLNPPKTLTQSHAATPRVHTCSQCGKSFRHLCRLRAHLRTHTGERLFSCSQCAKSFTQAYNLKQHELTHTGERPYHCSQCGKSFTQLCILKKHQRRLHGGARPYICSQCGKSFIWLCQLKLHMRVHTGERPYQCSQCPKSFTQAENLKQHQRTHTGERPYLCSQCGRSFTQRTALRNHMRTHTS